MLKICMRCSAPLVMCLGSKWTQEEVARKKNTNRGEENVSIKAGLAENSNNQEESPKESGPWTVFLENCDGWPYSCILEKILWTPYRQLKERMLQIISEATRSAKGSPSLWCHQKREREKKSLCCPNEVFQKWITPLSAKKKISYERLNLKWSPF